MTWFLFSLCHFHTHEDIFDLAPNQHPHPPTHPLMLSHTLVVFFSLFSLSFLFSLETNLTQTAPPPPPPYTYFLHSSSERLLLIICWTLFNSLFKTCSDIHTCHWIHHMKVVLVVKFNIKCIISIANRNLESFISNSTNI